MSSDALLTVLSSQVFEYQEVQHLLLFAVLYFIDKFKNGKDTEIEKQIEKTDPVGKQTNTGIEDEDLEKYALKISYPVQC